MSSGGLSSKPAQYGVWVARVSNGRSSEQLPAGNVLSGFDSRTLHHFLPFLSFPFCWGLPIVQNAQSAFLIFVYFTY